MGLKFSCQVLQKVVLICASLSIGNINAHPQPYFSVYDVAPKYGTDALCFDYVNASAPKGGALKIAAIGTFDGLNPFTIIGTSPIHIRIFCFARLLGDAPEEVGISYPYLAQSLEISRDKKTITYFLNPSATFSDGVPITAHDVVWSFNFMIKVNPMLKHYYQDIERAEAIDSHTVRFYSKNPKNKELPGILGQLEVLPSEFFKANLTENGCITKPFPSSGPYKIGMVDFGHRIVFERVKNWWGAKLPVNVGLYNFDQIELQFHRERNAAFQAFLAGNLNLWIEPSAKQWHTAYNVSPVIAGKIIKATIPNGALQATQGMVFNLRREKFKDLRVRKAISMLFNFNSLNRSMFYNQYYRLNSYYGSGKLAHKGVACGGELALLQSSKDQLPGDIFKKEFKNPEYAADLVPREVVSQALGLLKEAGWELKNQQLANKAGEVFEIIIPYADVAVETIILHMQRNFSTVGIKVTPRQFDTSTFGEIVEQFGFDMVAMQIPQSHSLGNEQREFFGSASAQVKGSKNLAGIANQVIDALIEKLVIAKDYQAMLDCAHAIDRVLCWNYYMIMRWGYDGLRAAYWDCFGVPISSPDCYPKNTPFPILAWWSKPQQVANCVRPAGALTKIKQTLKGWFS